ncbi:MAG: Rieske (2Fe-2S) protein [Chloroflexota bacterium]
MSQTQFVPAISYDELKEKGCRVVQLKGHTVALYATADSVYAVDNRCPHMGFPLDKGSVKDGILVCHWHHARFDLETGGTFDQFADDVRAFPVVVKDNEVWVDLARYRDPVVHQKDRLQVGLERDIPLVVGKAVLVLMEADQSAIEPFRAGLQFGSTYRQNGWGQGLTMHTCFMNMLPHLNAEDRPRALFQGLNAVSRDSFNHPPRFGIRPLPGNPTDIPTLKRWLRQFLAVRDSEGSERCIVSAIRTGATQQELADMLFSAVTDYRYIDIGHPADFTNKAFEALDIAGWELAEPVLTSLVSGYARAARMEESNAWRSPIDLIDILSTVFGRFGELDKTAVLGSTSGQVIDELVTTLLEDDPQATVDALFTLLKEGRTAHDLAQTVSYAAALRIARFHISNEFGDWDTALHTFTFANAIQMGLKRAPSLDLLRGVFDAAMSVYLDRFLNIPAARLPTIALPLNGRSAKEALNEFPQLLNQQQRVNQAAQLVADSLGSEGDISALIAMLGKLLLREDRDFHTIQSVEAAINQVQLLGDGEYGRNTLIAAARYLAAHSPTVRAQGQTYQIAKRLHRGDALFAD